MILIWSIDLFGFDLSWLDICIHVLSNNKNGQMMQAFAMDLFWIFDMIYGGDHVSHFEIRLDVSFRICVGLCSCTFRKPLDGQAIVFGNCVVILFRTQWSCQSFRD